MSLTATMNIASSGMRAAQTGLRTVSDNITNVNTPGYARKLVQQQSAVIDGAGAGVQVSGIRRAADLYLQKATLDASAEVGRSGVVAEFLDRAQALFGDPSEESSFFNRLDPVYAAFATASEDPTSGLRRSGALFEVDRFFDEAAEIGQGLRELSRQVEVRIDSVVNRINGLLDDINALNIEISRAAVTGRDASGSENVQSQLVDELASLVDIRNTPRGDGGVSLTATDGAPLTGDNRGRFSYTTQNGEPGLVQIEFDYGQPSSLSDGLGGGELKGLIELRDTVMPGLGEQLGEFTTRAADALNRAHNANSTTPAPTRLVGRSTWAPLADSIEGFTGRTTVAVTNPDGVVQHRVNIDFDARTFSTNGGAPSAWTPGTFRAGLDAALRPAGEVAFYGVMDIGAFGSGGITIADDPDAPSDRAGRSFSHYFGLNDLVQSTGPAFYDTGLTSTDPHGFTPGGQIRFRFEDGTGKRLPEATVTIPTAPSLGALLNTLNTTPGVRDNGVFSLDRGVLRFTSTREPPATLTVLSDASVHSGAAQNLTQLHGLGAQRALRAESFTVRRSIAERPANLALATFNTGAAVGDRGLSQGDGRGAFRLAEAGEASIRFERAGDVAAGVSTLSGYAAQMGGAVGRRSAAAEDRHESAGIVAREAVARRSSVEGVNLDEELIQLTVYQQAFNASARLITAVEEMFDTLLSMT